MSETPDADLSPERAASLLAQLPDYEERLTSRAFGLTLLIFALAGPAIGLTYDVAEPYLRAQGLEPLLGLLWMPWIAVALLATASLWRTHSLTLGQDHDQGEAWRLGLGFTLLYLLLYTGVSLLVGNTPLDVDPNVGNLAVAGVFSLAIAGVFHARYEAARLVVPLYVAGGAMIAVALGLAVLGLADVPASMAAWLTYLGAYTAAGLSLVRHG